MKRVSIETYIGKMWMHIINLLLCGAHDGAVVHCYCCICFITLSIFIKLVCVAILFLFINVCSSRTLTLSCVQFLSSNCLALLFSFLLKLSNCLFYLGLIHFHLYLFSLAMCMCCVFFFVKAVFSVFGSFLWSIFSLIVCFKFVS